MYKQNRILMRQKWLPHIKPCMVLRGYQYTDFLFLKSTEIDSPFALVEKKRTCVSRCRCLYIAKGTLKLLKF